MAERAAVKILKILDDNQINQFGHFLNSPYFNKNKDILIVYDAVIKYLKLGKNDNFDEFLLEFCDEKNFSLNISSAEKHLSNLYQHCLDFLTIETHFKNSLDKDISLLQHFYNTGNAFHFQKIIKKAYQKLKISKSSITNYKYFATLKKLESDFISVHKDKRSHNINLIQKSESFDIYYISRKLFDANLKLNRNKVTNESFDFTFTKTLINNIKNKPICELPLIKCHLNAFLVFTENNKKKYFSILLNTLENNLDSISNMEIFNLYSFIINTASDVYPNKKQYFKFMFQLYKKLVNNGLIYYQGNILASTYKNVVNISIKQKELKWLEKFIAQNKEKIVPESVKEDIFNYSLARLTFFKKDFVETQNLIVSLHFKDIYYKISLKRLELMLYFEKQEWLLLDSLINAFRVGLIPKRTETIPEIPIKYNLNFIKFFGKLFAAATSAKDVSKKLETLKTQLENTIEVSEKDWLLEVIDAKLA